MERTLEYDLNFLFSNPRIEIGNEYLTHQYLDIISNKIISFSKHNKKFSIIIKFETIRNFELYSQYIKIIEELNNSGHEVYISMTTSTPNKYFLNPLCSSIFFKLETWVGSYDSHFFNKNNRKIHKGILSVTRRNTERELFFKKYNKKFDGIFRYLDVDLNIKNKSNTEVSIENLLNEIKHSYVYFCFETITLNELNSFTEKSLIMFLCKTLPVIFLKNKNHLDELESMGFYLFNRELGYLGIDGTLEEKVDEFIKVVDIYNKIEIEKINKIYIKNYSKIQNNYNIISKIFFSDIQLNNKQSLLLNSNQSLFLNKKLF